MSDQVSEVMPEAAWSPEWAGWGMRVGELPDGQRAALEITVRSSRGESLFGPFGKLRLCPVRLRTATTFIAHVHRHHKNWIAGWKFGVGLTDDISLVGVVTVGRPSARLLDTGSVVEITRCAIMPNIPNGASMLLGAACRTARDLRIPRIITYTLAEEPGTSLVAAGFEVAAVSAGGSWNRPSRPRAVAEYPTGTKLRWERQLGEEACR